MRNADRWKKRLATTDGRWMVKQNMTGGVMFGKLTSLWIDYRMSCVNKPQMFMRGTLVVFFELQEQ